MVHTTDLNLNGKQTNSNKIILLMTTEADLNEEILVIFFQA